MYTHTMDLHSLEYTYSSYIHALNFASYITLQYINKLHHIAVHKYIGLYTMLTPIFHVYFVFEMYVCMYV